MLLYSSSKYMQAVCNANNLSMQQNQEKLLSNNSLHTSKTTAVVNDLHPAMFGVDNYALERSLKDGKYSSEGASIATTGTWKHCSYRHSNIY